jgi:hypothetical protein
MEVWGSVLCCVSERTLDFFVEITVLAVAVVVAVAEVVEVVVFIVVFDYKIVVILVSVVLLIILSLMLINVRNGTNVIVLSIVPQVRVFFVVS